MNRTEFQALSDERIGDANSLLEASRWSGAYYLAGYSLEAALKSCILAYVERIGIGVIIFEERKFAERCWTHDLETLVKQADLSPDRGRAFSQNANFEINWGIAKNWSEVARYKSHSQAEAEKLFEAITHPSEGVLQWLKNHW